MSFTNNDILTLAKAGFNAQQIAALGAVSTPVQNTQQASAQATAPDPMAQAMASLQLQNLLNATQPQMQTTDDILASIINPPDVNTGGK